MDDSDEELFADSDEDNDNDEMAEPQPREDQGMRAAQVGREDWRHHPNPTYCHICKQEESVFTWKTPWGKWGEGKQMLCRLCVSQQQKPHGPDLQANLAKLGEHKAASKRERKVRNREREVPT